MAEWNKNKVDPINLHEGQEFSKGDNLAVDELNAIVNNSFYASEKASKAIELAEGAVKGHGTPVTLKGEILPTWSADFAESERQKSETDGAIIHNLDAPVVFAESERQKSKNLFPYDTITGTAYTQVHLMKSIKAGTYTMSALISSTASSNNTAVVFENADKSYSPLFLLSRNGEGTTFTLDQDCYYVTFYASHDYATSLTHTFTFSNIQIEEGTVATSYQKYHGQIAHENDIYPIGSIYLSVNNTSPASIFGGTWEKIQDKFLLSSGSRVLGSEGGSTSHNHTLNNGYAEIGYSWATGLNYTLHANIINRDYQANLRTEQDATYADGQTWGQSRATALGGTTDNTEALPPYLVVNMWERVG